MNRESFMQFMPLSHIQGENKKYNNNVIIKICQSEMYEE